MLTEEEEKFVSYWKSNREKEKKGYGHIYLGLRLGLLLSGAILLNFISGWYERATIAANSRSTPIVLMFAIILITIFCTVFFKRHRWEMNEQRFLELSYKKETENSSSDMQHDEDSKSQVRS